MNDKDINILENENAPKPPTEKTKSGWKSTVVFFVKILITLALLFICYKIIDIDKLKDSVRNLEIKYLVLLVGIFWCSIFVGAIRSKIFFKGMGIKLSYFLYAKLYFIGYFFNNFIPSGVGGDVMRGWIAGKRSDKMKESYSAILAERLSGLLATVTIALITMIFIKSPTFIYLSIGGFFAFIWIVIIVLLSPGLTKLVRKILNKFPFGLADKIGDFSEKVSSYRKQPSIMINGFIMSALYQLSIIFTVWAASRIVDADISFPQMCIIAPAVWIISMIPLTPNAMGIREAAFSALFPLYGGNAEKGTLVSLAFFFVSIVSGLLGGLIFAIENMIGKKRGPEGIAAK